MPRQSRIDVLGALHPIIIRGMERRVIFRDDEDRVQARAILCYLGARKPGSPSVSIVEEVAVSREQGNFSLAENFGTKGY